MVTYEHIRNHLSLPPHLEVVNIATTQFYLGFEPLSSEVCIRKRNKIELLSQSLKAIRTGVTIEEKIKSPINKLNVKLAT